MVRSGSASQAIGVAISPSCIRVWFTTPNWSCSIQAHILAETTVGIAQGISTAARNRARPGNSAFITRARITPSTTSMATDPAAKTRVFQTAFHHSGSVSRPYQ